MKRHCPSFKRGTENKGIFDGEIKFLLGPILRAWLVACPSVLFLMAAKGLSVTLATRVPVARPVESNGQFPRTLSDTSGG